MGRRRKWK
jgi:hypothetical protein